jgi:hypothetical protein
LSLSALAAVGRHPAHLEGVLIDLAIDNVMRWPAHAWA